MNRGDLVQFWHPRKGGWYLGRITTFHRDGKIRVRRLHKREAFSLPLGRLEPIGPNAWSLHLDTPSEAHRSPQRPVTRKR